MAFQGFFANFRKYTSDLLKSPSKQPAAGPIIVILLVYALEQIITTKTFYECPATGHQHYGALFLFAPAVVFFMLSFLLHRSLWDSMSGYHEGIHDRGKIFRLSLKALRRSAFTAFIWLILGFANTDFYACFRLGPKPSKTASESLQQKYREVKSEAVVIAWSMLLSTTLFAFIYVIVRSCFFPEKQETIPSVEEYEKLERDAAIAKFKEEIKIIATREGQRQIEQRLQNAQKGGKQMYEVVKEAKEWMEKKYTRKKEDLIQEYRSTDGGGSPRVNGRPSEYNGMIMVTSDKDVV